MTQPTAFSEWLDVTMENRGIRGKDLAKQLGVHASAVSRWRAGKVVPSIEAVQKIATALGVEPLRLAVTAGLLDQTTVGVPPLEVPSAHVRRARVRQQLEQIAGLSSHSKELLLQRYDEIMEEE